MIRKKILKHIGLLFLVVTFIFLFLFIPENPYLSNYLKRLILPELQEATGYTPVAEKIYLHIFPLYAGIKDLRFIDEDGETFARIKLIKVYPELSFFISGRPSISRISVKAPSLIMNPQRIGHIKENLEDYLSKKEKGQTIIKRIDLSEGTFHLKGIGCKGSEGEMDDLFSCPQGIDISLQGIFLNYRLREAMEFKGSIKEIKLSNLSGEIGLTTSFSIHPEKIFLEELSIAGSRGFKDTGIKLSGNISTKTPSFLNAIVKISMEDMVKLFSLRSAPWDNGRLGAKGKIKIPGINSITDMRNFFEETEVNLKGEGDFYLENLMELLKVSERLSGRLKTGFSLEGRLMEPALKGTGHLFNGDLFGIEIKELHTEVQYKEHRLIFSNGKAGLYNGKAEAEAEIPLPVHTFRLYIKAQDIDIKPVLGLLHLDLPLPDGKIEGELSHSGRVFSPAGWFVYKAKGRLQALSDRKLERNPEAYHLEVRGDYMFDGENEVIVFHSLSGGVSNSPAEPYIISIVAKGSYSLNDKYINGKYLLHLRPGGENNSPLALPFEYLKFEKGELTGDIKGILSNLLITANLQLKDLSINGYTFNSVKGKVSYSPFLFHIESINGISQQDNGEFMLSGDIKFQSSERLFDISSPVFNLKTVFKDIKPLRFFSKNSLKPSPISNGVSNSRDLTLDGEVFFTGNRHTQDIVLRLGKEGTKIEGEINLTDWKNYSYNIYSQFSLQEVLKNWQGTTTSSFLSSLKGLFLFRTKGAGRSEELSGFAELSTDMLSINGRPAGSVKVSSVIQQRSFKNGMEITSAGSFFDGLVILKGRLQLFLFGGERNSFGGESNTSQLTKESNEPYYSFEIEFKDDDYGKLLQALIKEPPEDLALGLRGKFLINGQGNVISGEAFFDKFLISGYGHQLKNNGPVQIDIARNVLTVKNFNMINEAGTLTCSGKVLIGKWYDLELKGRSYLWPFKRFSRSIKTIKGKVDFELAINGKWDSPGVSGFLTLKEGTIGVEDIPYHVTEVESVIRFKENRIDVESLTGKVAGGNVMAKGIAYLRGYRLGRFNMEVNLQNINATITEGFSANLSANLYLKGDRYLNLISGEARLKRAFYRRFIEWRSWMLRFKKEPPQPELNIPSYLNARLNIRITGPLPEPSSLILVDNNIANAELKIDLLLKGTLQKPIIIGRVETIKGVVYFRNNELKLIKASADFTDTERIDPYLRIRAETLSRGYRINLLIEGTLRRFNLSLSSEPPLDEVDIISLLAIGETGTALKGYGGGIGAAEATSFITGELQETLEQRARHYTGIDRVQISPYVSKTGEVGPRITVGKKLGERVSILYSSAVGSKESDVIKVEYELSRSVFLVGEKDERGSIGGDIRFRFQFR